MSHVAHEWVMSHMNDSRLIWRSQVSYEWVMSHINKLFYINTVACCISTRRVSFEWVVSHMNMLCLIWMSHVPREWAMFYMNCLISKSHESCPMCMSHAVWMVSEWQWVMSHVTCRIHEPPVAIWKSENSDPKKLPKCTGSVSLNKSVAITAYIVEISSRICSKTYVCVWEREGGRSGGGEGGHGGLRYVRHTCHGFFWSADETTRWNHTHFRHDLLIWGMNHPYEAWLKTEAVVCR